MHGSKPLCCMRISSVSVSTLYVKAFDDAHISCVLHIIVDVHSCLQATFSDRERKKEGRVNERSVYFLSLCAILQLSVCNVFSLLFPFLLKASKERL